MSIETVHLEDEDNLIIKVDGRFDFSFHAEFKSAYERTDIDEPDAYVVDLLRTTELDSSALGMLLLLRDHAGGDEAKVSIINCSKPILRILNLSNFGQLFDVYGPVNENASI